MSIYVCLKTNTLNMLHIILFNVLHIIYTFPEHKIPIKAIKKLQTCAYMKFLWIIFCINFKLLLGVCVCMDLFACVCVLNVISLIL